MDTYKTIAAKSEGLYKDKGSRFVSYAFPVTTDAEIKDHLIQVKKEHHSARHLCYAWRLGTGEPAFRMNDGGEPSSTAGKPILGQLIHFDLTNVLLVVARYFGGVLLGTGGLINAYRSAAEDALNNAVIITKILEKRFRLKFSYKELNDVMLAVKQENLTVVNTVFEVDCQLDFTVRESESAPIHNFFHQMYPVEIEPLYQWLPGVNK